RGAAAVAAALAGELRTRLLLRRPRVSAFASVGRRRLRERPVRPWTARRRAAALCSRGAPARAARDGTAALSRRRLSLHRDRAVSPRRDARRRSLVLRSDLRPPPAA